MKPAYIAIILAIVALAALTLTPYYTPQYSPYGECLANSDCVPADCCHPDSCVPKEQAPNCTAVACTMNCEPDTMDCGHGQCECQAGKCTAVITGW
jgi:hypothetical protein